MRKRAITIACVCACGRLDFDPTGVGDVEVTVGPSYPIAGADWNAYVRNDGSDQPCDLTAHPFSACLHGGELRTATITGVTSCSGLVLADALDAFDWTCRLVGSSVTFDSALKPGRGLRDLVTTSGWRDEQVTLSGTATAASSIGAWWHNPVAPLPDNSGGTTALDLAVPEQIYVAETTVMTAGYQITSDGVAIVTLVGAELTSNASPAPAMLAATGVSRTWIEVSADTAATVESLRLTAGSFHQLDGSTFHRGRGVVLDGVTSSQVRHLRAIDSSEQGLYIGDTATSDDNFFFDIGVSSAGYNGIYLHYGQRNVLDGVILANNEIDGIKLGSYCDGGGAQHNTVTNLRTFDNFARGIFINSKFNVVVGALAVANGQDGIAFSNNCGYADHSAIVDALTAFNAGNGVGAGDYPLTLNNVVALGNAAFGVDVVAGTSAWSNVAACDSQQGDLRQGAAATFAGNLLVLGNMSCANPAGYAGASDVTCAPTSGSAASLHYVGSALLDFVREAPDAANGSDLSGSASYPVGVGFDWLEFDNSYRVWGNWGSPVRWTSGTASILDFRLLASATLLDNTGTVVALNDPFVVGAACPGAVNGANFVFNDLNSDMVPDQRYLLDATEIVSPSSPGWSATGNHDGLCESGEHCLYTPNFGVYQGEGALGVCTFVDGTVSGVTMYGYSTDGV